MCDHAYCTYIHAKTTKLLQETTSTPASCLLGQQALDESSEKLLYESTVLSTSMLDLAEQGVRLPVREVALEASRVMGDGYSTSPLITSPRSCGVEFNSLYIVSSGKSPNYNSPLYPTYKH